MNRKLTEKDLNQDYRILGYNKTETVNSKGELSQVDFFQDLEKTILKVREIKVWERDDITGILNKQTETIKWYDGGGIDEVINKVGEKSFIKNYSTVEGIKKNEKCRERLIEKSKEYVLNEIGYIKGMTAFAELVPYISTYIEGIKTPLLETISNSINTDLTALKGELLNILQ